MNPFFKNIKIFLPKNPFFLRKISKIGHISQEFLSFLKNYFKLRIILEGGYKSREIPDEFYYLVETSKKLKNGLDRGLLEMGLKFLKFLEKID